jgi:UDP-glucose:(heptosyl)LPS alpha-1,3-glucosyltransferase
VLRIALVIDRFDPGRGGGEGYAVSLARGLTQRGNEVHVFAQSWSEGIEGVRLRRLPVLSYPRGAKAVSLAASALRVVSRSEFHVVQGFGGAPGVDVHRPGGGAELAWWIQEIRSRDGRWDRILGALTRTVSLKLLTNLAIERALYGAGSLPLVVANSRKVQRDLLRFHHGMDPRRIRVIPNGVDLARFHPGNRDNLGREVRREIGVTPDVAVILFMAHNFRLKGLGPLLKALGALGQAAGPWVLWVVGRGRRRPYERLAQQWGIGQRVRFLDAVSAPEAMLAASDILAHPTFYDPFSNVCLEAMASGIPVITTAQNGAGEVMVEGVTGFVLEDPRVPEALEERLRALMDPDVRERMGREARRVSEGLSWQSHLDRLEKVYGEALSIKENAGRCA